MSDLYETDYFTSLSQEFRRRAARALAGKLSPASASLRRYLVEHGNYEPGEPGAFLADPVFEATFPWVAGPERLAEMAGTRLHPDLVRAMDMASSEQRLSRDTSPYLHQVQAWDALQQGKSIVVTSGTSSGKTECYLLPILDQLIRDSERQALTGVRALFLYPLNALINSQRDRMSQWSRPFRGRVRFCLYNGETPEDVPEHEMTAHSEEVRSRTQLRDDPPPILVTNATMLEYMLVRLEDQAILSASRGRLRWIVLDEAHTYLGSQAADVALLLRRVLHAFAVRPEDVRFIATSATIRSGDGGKERLARYMADMTGLPVGQIEVISGRRALPPLPDGYDGYSELLPEPLDALAAADPQERFLQLAAVPGVRTARSALGGGARSLTQIVRLLHGRDEQSPVTADEKRHALRLLDLARSARWEGTPLLPLRGHFFHRTQGGLWACASPRCSEREAAGLGPDWPFGRLYHERKIHCTCGAPVYEVALCASCGTEYLLAQEQAIEGKTYLMPVAPAEQEDELEEDDVDEDEREDVGMRARRRRLLQSPAARMQDQLEPMIIDRTTRERDVHPGPNTLSLAYQMPGDDGFRCYRCREREQTAEQQFRPVRAGGPFFLSVSTPTLLEHVPPRPGDGARPMEGRRAITFTDSRQGTARFAALAQLDAERNYLRGWIYHQVWAEARTPDPQKIAALQEELAGLAPLRHVAPVAKVIEQKEGELATLLAPAQGHLSWSTAVDLLANTNALSWMRNLWRHRGDGVMDKHRAARFCLFREFVRRPKRSTSLETLGLVQLRYPALDEVESAPAGWPLGLPAWRSFLRLCLDFFVRAYSAVRIDPEFLRWMGTRIRTRTLVAPDVPVPREDRNRLLPWSQIRDPRRPPAMAQLLLTALNLSAEDQDAREQVNQYLWAAWLQLRRRELLRTEAEGARLELESVELVTPLLVYRCPVTFTALGTTLTGLTPYLTPHLPQEQARCTEVSLPRLPAPFPDDRRGLLAWLEQDPLVLAARDQGLWREMADRIAVGSAYFQVGEHSAQQPSARLKQLEEQFKDGYLNLLSCSTTMEMGVDIGGISAVSMNNAPPGPANFLQRAGRAGRRGETASVSLTMCKAVPHGEAVFHDPLWPFTAPIEVPTVSLQSERIVQRHINALALNSFLTAPGTNSVRLKAGPFFYSAEESSTPATRFVAWLREEARHEDAPLLDGIRRISGRSCLSGLEPTELLERCAEDFTAIQERWLNERRDLAAELAQVSDPGRREPTPAQLALGRQIARQDGEYLLALLSSSRFLPGHGFPTGVVPFITTNLEQLRREERERNERDGGEGGEREDSRFRRRGFPSRDIATAIREYAPGATVVLDGQVYRSDGVTLNWHVPPGDLDQAHELQSFRHAWRCTACGASGDSLIRVTKCPSCECDTRQFRCFSYLEPAGFAVEIFYQPTNDLTIHDYIPVMMPWISAGGVPFLPLPRPGLGRYRYNTNGHIFQHSGGANGHGYAICLRCGRAASETAWVTEDDELPAELRDHYRLRGGKERDRDRAQPCTGNSSRFAIKRNQMLGVAAQTDVFELQLRDPMSGAILRDERVAVSIGVALRQALAQSLGIDEREIGFATTAAQYESGETGCSIVLFDTASGGAGYVAKVSQALDTLLRRAWEILRCPNRRCDQACHGCLLSFDTQYYIDQLDRHAALGFLTEELLAALSLPEELRFFGTGSRLEFESLPGALRRELQKPEAQALRLYLGGDPDLWDPAFWPFRRDLLRLAAANGDRIELSMIAPRRVLDALPAEVASSLASFLEGTGVHLRVLDGEVADPSVPTLIAEVVSTGRTQRWAVQDPALLLLGEDWASAGQVELARCIYASQAQVTPAQGTPLPPARLRRTAPGVYREVVLPARLTLALSGVAAELWRRLTNAVPELKERLRSGPRLANVEYHDRYLNSPLTVRLLVDLLGHLRQHPGGLDATTSLRVVTTGLRESWQPRGLQDDWPYENERNEVIKQVFAAASLPLSFESLERRRTQHARQLTLRWTDGATWTVRLDQGLGFLRPVRDGMPYPFGRPPQEQAQHLLGRVASVEPRDEIPVVLYTGTLQRA